MLIDDFDNIDEFRKKEYSLHIFSVASLRAHIIDVLLDIKEDESIFRDQFEDATDWLIEHAVYNVLFYQCSCRLENHNQHELYSVWYTYIANRAEAFIKRILVDNRMHVDENYYIKLMVIGNNIVLARRHQINGW